ESLAKALYLQTEEIDRDAAFVELGLDSIIGVEWVSALNKRYGTSLAASRLYDYPNLTALAKHLRAQESYQAQRSQETILPASAPQPSDPVRLPPVDD